MDSKLVAAELKKIEKKSGAITPLAVVEAAKPKTHPLHSYFQWDDKKAGHHWRIQQARQLISSVKVIIEVEDRQIKTVAYVRDPDAKAEDQGYRDISRLAETDSVADAVLIEFDRAESHLRRAYSVALALDCASDIDELISRLVNLGANLRQRNTRMMQAAE